MYGRSLLAILCLLTAGFSVAIRSQGNSSVLWELENPFDTILSDLEYHLAYKSKNPNTTTADKIIIERYNQLRRLLDEGEACSYDEIDQQWLLDIEEEAITHYPDIEKTNCAQRELTNRALKHIDPALKIAVVSTPTSGFSSHRLLAVCKDPDMEHTTGEIYHELGHILHGDAFISEELSKGNLSEQGICQTPEFQSRVGLVNHYIECGKKVLDTSTDLGKFLQPLVKKYATFWNRPEDSATCADRLIMLQQERDADLFALTKLHECKNYDALLTFFYGSYLYRFIHEGDTPQESDIVACSTCKHPSRIERALMMVGFLAEQGFDVNAVIKNYELTSICTSEDHVCQNPTIQAPKRASISFRKAYAEKLSEERMDTYEQWKTHTLERYSQDKKTLLADLINVISDTPDIHELNPESLAYRRVLYAYNLIAEHIGIRHIAALNEIKSIKELIHAAENIQWHKDEL